MANNPIWTVTSVWQPSITVSFGTPRGAMRHAAYLKRNHLVLVDEVVRGKSVIWRQIADYKAGLEDSEPPTQGFRTLGPRAERAAEIEVLEEILSHQGEGRLKGFLRAHGARGFEENRAWGRDCDLARSRAHHWWTWENILLGSRPMPASPPSRHGPPPYTEEEMAWGYRDW